MQKEVSTITRCVIWNKEASLAVIDLSAVVREAARRHGLSPLAAAVFGRAAVCCAYLCSWAEDGQEIALGLDGNGNAGKISVYGNGALHLCGCVENPPAGELEGDIERRIKESVGSSGSITVTIDGGRGLPFSGAVSLTNGDIASDMEEYFRVSEQRPTAISLFEGQENGELACGGVFLQPLTGASPEVYKRAEETVKKCSSLRDAEALAAAFLREGGQVRAIDFACSCSREKAERALLTVGFQAALDCIRAEGDVTVHCFRCNHDYKFGEQDIRKIFRKQL